MFIKLSGNKPIPVFARKNPQSLISFFLKNQAKIAGLTKGYFPLYYFRLPITFKLNNLGIQYSGWKINIYEDDKIFHSGFVFINVPNG